MQFKRFLSVFTLLAAVLMLSGLTFSAEALSVPLPRDPSDTAEFEVLPERFGGLGRTSAAVSNRKIVVFDPTFVNETAKDELLSKFGVVKIKNLDLIGARAVYLPEQVEALLARQGGVLRIEDDLVVEALSHNTTQPAEVLPWGVDRIDAEQAWVTTTADPIKVAVIDTGIELSHPDLKNNIKGGVNTIRPTRSANDDNGHGTHVAGTVAALDNTIGVVGVGPKIDLYAVKVLAANGSGWLSDIIEGLDWAIANNMDVVNMSLGTSGFSQSFADAVKRVYDAGIVVVAAAGNSGSADNTVLYPAKFPESIAVSATASNDALAGFSSRGPEVDLAAPGVSIYSTYKGKTYKTLSGTSMAAPHVAGVAALVLSVGNCGGCSPAEVQAKLEATAEDLGAAGKDNLYGSGLVDALAAVTQ